ncbi:hypothetical protein [uncultured Ruminococcus sp.]|uniref:hypothetical protein n=1 Tax=uncultured Ruminococcus sp. TaxID=165186 RepID=UPI00260F404E|nr:hypothetical protein [uncultured Ruminococcus sp.]
MKVLKIALILICNILYSLFLEVYWLAYYGELCASGSIIFANSLQHTFWKFTPIFVALIAGLGIFANTLLFKKKRNSGDKEKKWTVVYVISIIVLSLPAIIGLIDFAEYLIYGDRLYNK